jgi:hypothetical protein
MPIGEYALGSPPGVGDSYVDRTISYDLSQITVFTGVVPIEGGFQYSMNRTAGLYLLSRITSTFDMGYASGISGLTKIYQMSTSILDNLRGISIDVILRPSYESTIPATSVLDALVWSYTDMFDAVWRQMDTMSTVLKLDYAQGSDLDDAWGQIYDLPRIYNEDDTNYRDRLKTRTVILNSSGTIANCEAIIDSIVGSTSTTITTRYPSSVDITFSTVEAMRVAKSKSSTLAILLPQMLASGISYNLFLPFIDYYIDMVMIGPNYLPYNMVTALTSKNTLKTYIMEYTQNVQSTITFDIDHLINTSFEKSLLIGSLFDKLYSKSYLIDIGLFGTVIKSIPFDMISTKKNALKYITMDSYFTKYNISKSFYIDSVLKGTKHRYLSMTLTNVYHNLSTWYQDMILKLFSATYSIDLLSKRGFPKKCGMTIKLVGA